MVFFEYLFGKEKLFLLVLHDLFVEEKAEEKIIFHSVQVIKRNELHKKIGHGQGHGSGNSRFSGSGLTKLYKYALTEKWVITTDKRVVSTGESVNISERI